MAKKQPEATATKQTRNLTVAIGILRSEGNTPLEDLKKINGVTEVVSAGGLQTLESLRNVEADLYLVSQTPDQVKNAYVQALIKQAGTYTDLHNQYFTLVTGDNRSRLTEWFSGIGKAEWNNAFIAFDQAAFSKFADEAILPLDAYELAYLAEKTCASNELVVADKKEISKPANMAALGKKFRTTIKYYSGGGMKAIHKYTFTCLSILALILGMVLSKDAGISGDEFTQYEYSKLTANYYESMLGGETSVDTMGLKGQKMTTLVKKSYTDPDNLATQEDPERLMHLYGASFDTITTLMARWFGVTEIMDFRHLINSIFGFFCVFFGALIIRRVTGGSWKYAWITLVLLFCTPRLLGESFNNPKDIPFAAGYVMAIYYTVKSFSNLSLLRFSSLLGLVISVALGISIRIGGILSIAIFIMYAGLQFIRKIGTKNFISFRWKGFGKLLLPVAIVTVCSYLLGIFLWPYGWDDPITNPMKAFKSFSNYAGSIRQLFDGKLYDSDMLPSHYLLKYILITTPIAALLGIILNALLPAWKKTKFDLNFFLVFFAAAFPVLFIFIQKSQVYGGLRHILFTIPMFVASGVVGYYLLEQWLKEKKWSAYAVPALALGLTTLPASFIAKNHPLEYIYFNELVGGTSGAYGKYEMDYYLAGLRPSTEWFLENVARKNPTKRYQVLTYGMDQVKYYCRHDTNVKVGFTRYDDRSEKKWDYAIFYNAYLDQERLLGGKYPPFGTVYSPMVDGKPMGLVIQRPSNDDYEGLVAHKDSNYRGAIEHYKNYLKLDKNSNEVYFYMAAAYAEMDNTDSAIWAAKKSLEIYPEFSLAIFGTRTANNIDIYGLRDYYNAKKDYDSQIKLMDKYIQSRPKSADGYFYKAQAQANKGLLKEAISTIQEAVAVAPVNAGISPNIYSLGAQLYKSSNDELSASDYYKAMQFFSAKDAQQYETGLEAIKSIYLNITGKELDTEKLQ